MNLRNNTGYLGNRRGGKVSGLGLSRKSGGRVLGKNSRHLRKGKEKNKGLLCVVYEKPLCGGIRQAHGGEKKRLHKPTSKKSEENIGVLKMTQREEKGSRTGQGP